MKDSEDISVWGRKQTTADILPENLLQSFPACCGWLEQPPNSKLLTLHPQRELDATGLPRAIFSVRHAVPHLEPESSPPVLQHEHTALGKEN